MLVSVPWRKRRKTRNGERVSGSDLKVITGLYSPVRHRSAAVSIVFPNWPFQRVTRYMTKSFAILRYFEKPLVGTVRYFFRD
ncbi:hypothetical protein L596_005976 [Steinernema carpocapsae]|uniref:Uncharacterized protein n=1 Tax=Steinernema carpocapsae TaxID=34508 RepID=A0A4U8V0P7_STECR|nr:hypothetical protein L596_005976 [Steinernema carpocapsae]